MTTLLQLGVYKKVFPIRTETRLKHLIVYSVIDILFERSTFDQNVNF